MLNLQNEAFLNCPDKVNAFKVHTMKSSNTLSIFWDISVKDKKSWSVNARLTSLIDIGTVNYSFELIKKIARSEISLKWPP